MSYTLIIFPTPLDALCVLQPDNGPVIHGVPVLHPTGRQGQGFTLVDGTNQANGATLTISSPGKVGLIQRGILFLNNPGFAYPWTPGQTAAFAADDFHLAVANVNLPRLVSSGEFLVQDLG